jgi:hypothetical protein
MLQFLNYFFFVFHTAFTLFNIVGWMFRKTRKWHLATMILTALSWFVLGIWYGFGYCACTDWHWDVREQLGYHDQQRSYIHFLVLKLTGINVDEHFVDVATLIVFLVCFILTIALNIKDRKQNTAG